MAMKLSTGKVAFPIEFDNGDKDVIYFNPNDPNLPIRMIDFQEKVSKRINDLQTMSNSNDKQDQEYPEAEEIKNVQKIICEELDVAFGGEVSSVVFKHCSPFAIINGEYFISVFINAVRPEIEKQIKKTQKEMNAKMEKHIAKYR